MNDDAQLIHRLLTGEAKAYEELVSRYQSAMRLVAYAIVGPRSCDDVVQDAWLSVMRHMSGFQGRSSLKTWLVTITANHAKRHYRQNMREVFLDDLPSAHGVMDNCCFSSINRNSLVVPHVWHQDTPDALLTERELCGCLTHTLLSLPPLQSNVLLLRERQGLPLGDICTLLGISMSNARVLLHRARLKVFATVAQFEKTGKC